MCETMLHNSAMSSLVAASATFMATTTLLTHNHDPVGNIQKATIGAVALAALAGLAFLFDINPNDPIGLIITLTSVVIIALKCDQDTIEVARIGAFALSVIAILARTNAQVVTGAIIGATCGLIVSSLNLYCRENQEQRI